MQDKKVIIMDDFIMELSTVAQSLHEVYMHQRNKCGTLLADALLLDRMVEELQEVEA